jgi:hypothetical protein
MWEPDDRMKRREFMILLSGTVSWPLAARGQQVAKLPIVGRKDERNVLPRSQRSLSA